jgi:hypothetical protein
MPEGKIMHDSIATSAVKSHECTIGWIAHYSIGVAFAVLFVGVMGDEWLTQPTLLPALMFGVITVVVPLFILQPALGLGIAASRARNPTAARRKSLATHAIFGTGLYLSACAL